MSVAKCRKMDRVREEDRIIGMILPFSQGMAPFPQLHPGVPDHVRDRNEDRARP